MRWLLLALLLGCDAAPSGWHVSDGFLRAPDGRAVILRGVNLSGAQKQSPYLDFHGADDYARIRRDWGMNAVRFLMTWSAVEPQPGVYDKKYLDEVALRMKHAADAGLVVILDMHQDVYGEGFGFDGAPRWTCDEARYAAFVPRTPWFFSYLDENVAFCVDRFYTDLGDEFVAAWGQVAARLAKEPAIIGFDPLNEPHWGTYSIFDFENDRLLPLYRRVAAEVRRHAPGWIAFLEPAASRNAGIATGMKNIDIANVAYAPHSYDSVAEGGGGFGADRRVALEANVAALGEEARALGAALWIGEYGGNAAHAGIGDYMDAQYDAAGAQGGSTMYWEYGRNNGYGMLDPDGNEKPALMAALVRPYPLRVAGGAISYSLDDGGFRLRYTPRGAGVTEIAVPARWSASPSVECGGCRWEVKDEVARLLTPPSGAVVIR